MFATWYKEICDNLDPGRNPIHTQKVPIKRWTQLWAGAREQPGLWLAETSGIRMSEAPRGRRRREDWMLPRWALGVDRESNSLRVLLGRRWEGLVLLNVGTTVFCWEHLFFISYYFPSVCLGIVFWKYPWELTVFLLTLGKGKKDSFFPLRPGEQRTPSGQYLELQQCLRKTRWAREGDLVH